MKYRIVNEEYLGSLMDEVNRLIKKGWIPQGGVGLSVRLQSLSGDQYPKSYQARNDVSFHQAMVKGESNNEN